MSISGRPSVFVPQGPKIPGDILQSNGEFTKDVKMYRNLTVGMPYDAITHPFTDILTVNGNIVVSGTVTPGGSLYANFYNIVASVLNVAKGATVPFPTVGPAGNGTVTPIATGLGNGFQVPNTGNYSITFNLNSVSTPTQVVLRKNAVIYAPNAGPGAAWATGGGTEQLAGVYVLALTAGDIIDLLVPSDATNILTVPSVVGGATAQSLISLMIRQL